MNIKDLVEEIGLTPKRKASLHGGEYCSPCPFCKEGNDRFLIWPQRLNKNGEYQGGRYSCRKCSKYGDAITFLRTFHGMGYKEACAHLQLESKTFGRRSVIRDTPKFINAQEPAGLWKEKAAAFTEWANKQLLKSPTGMDLLRERGFNNETISRFKLGFNPKVFYREREEWGLVEELKEDGKLKKLWLPTGIIIPTFAARGMIKVKIRRSNFIEDGGLPKYIEISGSKKCLSVYGDTNLPVALIMESEIDALLMQQEAGDLVYCVAIGGSTKSIDAETAELIKDTPTILFLPDFDEAGAKSWEKWKASFPKLNRILTPHEKSAGDYYKAGGNLREWLEAHIIEIKRKGG